MAMMNNLYKRGIGDKILYWRSNVEVSEGIYRQSQYRLVYEYGEFGEDGYDKTITRSYSDYITGKANRTNSEQADRELNSLYERQIKKGYKSLQDAIKQYINLILKDNPSNVTYEKYIDAYGKQYDLKDNNIQWDVLNEILPKYNTDANNCIKPMKCQKFQIGKMNYPCVAQPKINGVRCTIMYEESKSTIGKDDLFSVPETIQQCVIKSKEGLIYKVKHIEEVFNKFYSTYSQYKDIVFDGELYLKDKPVTTIGGAARSLTKDNIDIHKQLQFICFDLSIPDVDQQARDNLRYDLGYILWQQNNFNSNRQLQPEDHNKFKDYKVVILGGNIVYDDNESLSYMERCIDCGYEGAVIRDLNATYQFGSRPMTMRKLKKFEDAEFKILGIRHVGNPNDKVGFTVNFICQNDINDKTFDPTVVGTVEERLEYVNNPNNYIGKLATVKFYERTKYGLPFHANVIGIRDYEK